MTKESAAISLSCALLWHNDRALSSVNSFSRNSSHFASRAFRASLPITQSASNSTGTTDRAHKGRHKWMNSRKINSPHDSRGLNLEAILSRWFPKPMKVARMIVGFAHDRGLYILELMFYSFSQFVNLERLFLEEFSFVFIVPPTGISFHCFDVRFG